MSPLRSFLSILLLAAFCLPFASPLFALGTGAETGVPACCRKAGKHHCMMNLADGDKAPQHETQLAPPVEKCPYAPGSMTTAHTNLLAPGTSSAVFAELVSHPTGHAQSESKRRISRDRSRQKRGPPASILL